MPAKKYCSIVLLLSLASCTGPSALLKTSFEVNKIAPAPDYALNKNWAAHPLMKDPSDSVPALLSKVSDKEKPVDVFFIHPTTFTARPADEYKWNADVRDVALNSKTDYSTILYQASIFNESCNVYAPRYRQAHVSVFFTKKKADAKAALDLAYSDVRNAFAYYMENYNSGKPIIIAAHSQGTAHAYRLMKDFFNDSLARERIVAAYLVGMPVNADSLVMILPVCGSKEQTHCLCAWNTFENGYYPSYYKDGLINSICVNPLSWQTDTVYCAASLNKGAVLFDFNNVMPHLFDAKVHEGMLWTTKPKFPGSFLIRTRIYHRGDYNLFYTNIRENVKDRVQAYFKELSAGVAH